ncbi:integrase, catalytic region [Ruegeria lacuscaerulensis ITI-1157]|nr:integrase, catalytic region [Ruegeria lacuscaerulensis ITI-1157]
MAKRANPNLLSDRTKRDKALRPEIERVWKQNYKVYGVRKVWHLPLRTLLCNALPGSGCAGKASMWPDARWRG